MNISDQAIEVCRREGGKKNLQIAQVKEAMRCLRDLHAENPEAMAKWAVYVQRQVVFSKPVKKRKK